MQHNISCAFAHPRDFLDDELRPKFRSLLDLDCESKLAIHFLCRPASA